ncbi:ubc-like protein [Phaffia rhodozyma]|uniref:Ubiquitin-conjugating enzyme E2 6 n=1 Tax=Phaffia rhodozyma TaxID=264483 RepID=A0A0F7ST71_PHARH|nr:ubc-like protein [Phaffia rhodozyma]
MASPAARKRLGKEYTLMQKTPPPFVWAVPDEKNILNWHFILRGPPDTPYAGGEYYGMVMFPGDYPFKPPDIKMITPSGRFKPETKICTSMTSFHPSTWNPAWSVATILTGLLSFMLSDEITTGSISTTNAERVSLAEKSHAWNLSNKKFKDMFPDYCTPKAKDVPDMPSSAPAPSDSTSSTSVSSPPPAALDSSFTPVSTTTFHSPPSPSIPHSTYTPPTSATEPFPLATTTDFPFSTSPDPAPLLSAGLDVHSAGGLNIKEDHGLVRDGSELAPRDQTAGEIKKCVAVGSQASARGMRFTWKWVAVVLFAVIVMLWT